jgi:predicted DNA-binding transcriptional regulator AlpA
MKICIDNEEVLNINEVMQLLSIKEHRVYEKVNSGEIPHPIKPEFRSYWKLKDIKAYLEKIKE